MTTPDPANSEQAQLWNGPAGHSWVQAQALLDQMFAPLQDHLAERAAVLQPRQVLDIGCGTGAVTLAIARRQPPPQGCLGVDISAPMIEAARQRAAAAQLSAHFLCADAQAHPFALVSVDLLVSRFGVMFFADPVAAFTNMRQAMQPGGRMHCLAWRGAEKNPFMTTAERAAADLLPLPPRRPGQPGQFAFADAAQVAAMLRAAGWQDVVLHPLDRICTITPAQLDTYLGLLGPVGVALREADAATRERVLPVVREAFAAYVDGGTVQFTAACWELCARA